MRLLPSPKQLAHAADNVATRVLQGGWADVTPLPSTQIEDSPQCALFRYDDAADGAEPVLLIPPLAAPAFVYDLHRGNSLAEYLLDAGLAPYLVDYGAITFAERNLGLEHWVDEVIPSAVRKVSADAGGQRVHLVGWSLGGVMTALTVAADQSLPVATATLVGTPFDASRVTMVAPFRPLVEFTGGAFGTMLYRTIGTAPSMLVRRAYQVATFDNYLLKPLKMLQTIGDRDGLAQIDAVDRMMDNMIAYPGRVLGQLYHDVYRANTLADGTFELAGRTIDMRDVNVPLLSFAGSDDGIAPAAAVHHLADFLPETTFVDVPGGHLGMLTGRGARDTTWPRMTQFFAEHSGRGSNPRRPRSAPKAA